MVSIREAKTPGDIRKFIRLPWRIYQHIEQWVPPLLREEKEIFNPKRHPFYKHSEVKLFLAEKNGTIVGRIAGIINHNHNVFHQERVGFFGFFECQKDQEVANALFHSVADFLCAHQMEIMRGPMNFSTNEVCGLLVKGYELPPYVMMPYNPPYYAELIEGYGFKKSKDLLAYYMRREFYEPRISQLAERVRRKNKVQIRCIDKSRFNEEIKRLRGVYNFAWERNWGFVPVTDDEFYFIAKKLKQIADPRLCIVAEHQGSPIGFMLNIPNINLLLKKMKGRLFPFGIFVFLLGLRRIKQIRTITLGVVKEFRRRGIETLFYHRLYELSNKLGVEEGEFSWILEDNYLMRRALEQINAKPYKIYRIYDYPLVQKLSPEVSSGKIINKRNNLTL